MSRDLAKKKKLPTKLVAAKPGQKCGRKAYKVSITEPLKPLQSLITRGLVGRESRLEGSSTFMRHDR